MLQSLSFEEVFGLLHGATLQLVQTRLQFLILQVQSKQPATGTRSTPEQSKSSQGDKNDNQAVVLQTQRTTPGKFFTVAPTQALAFQASIRSDTLFPLHSGAFWNRSFLALCRTG